MNKLLTKFIVGTAMIGGLASCSPAYTPQRAAETGGKTCNDHHRITMNDGPALQQQVMAAAADNGAMKAVITAPTP